MASLSSSVGEVLARAIKIAVVVLLLPPVIGIVQAGCAALEKLKYYGGTGLEWFAWGFGGYIGVHLFLFRPRPVFAFSHRLFSFLAVWLFGGQVASVEETPVSRSSRSRRGAAEKSTVASPDSPLVAFSPYAMPLYTVLACLAAMGLMRWIDRVYVSPVAAAVVGATLAFQWVMTADDLQEQREQWFLETYLLALVLVFLITLLIVIAASPWAVPGFEPGGVLADGWSRAQAMYASLWRQIFR